ncbi:MAG TPA: hypothetical protein V6C84_22815 [Coleofasciculaceae cyanobacterium]
MMSKLEAQLIFSLVMSLCKLQENQAMPIPQVSLSMARSPLFIEES